MSEMKEGLQQTTISVKALKREIAFTSEYRVLLTPYGFHIKLKNPNPSTGEIEITARELEFLNEELTMQDWA
jgi:hypothetical protein